MLKSNGADSCLSPQMMITEIFNSLGFAVVDLELVLGAKRATLYNWKKGVIEPQINEKIAQLKSVYSIAKKIGAFNQYPYGRMAKTYEYKGETLLQRLSSNNLNEALILEHAKMLSNMIKKRIEAHAKHSNKNLDIDEQYCYLGK